MTKARNMQPQQETPVEVLPVRVVGVHLAASKTTQGRLRAMTDFARRAQDTINEMVREGRDVTSSIMNDQGVVVIGRLEVGPPPAVLAALQAHAMQQQAQQESASPPGPALEIGELSHRMVQQFMSMACRMPPMPQERQEKQLSQLFDTLVHGVMPNDLQAAAEDVGKILAYRKRREEAIGVPSDQMEEGFLIKMRDMLTSRVKVSLH